MRNTRRMRLLLCSSLLGLTVPCRAAEVIKVPGGVVVRSLFDWEGTNGLEATLGGRILPGTRTPDGADLSFSDESLCALPAYRSLTADGVLPFVDLGHLCRTRQLPGREDDSVTFALIADTQELDDEHRKTAALLSDLTEQYPNVEFVVTAGDIVDRGNAAQWGSYRKIAESYTYRLPIVPVLGNHEYFDNPDLSFFNRVYTTESTRKGYYSIDLGPAVLIVLNSNVDRMSTQERATQTSWLAMTLAAHSTRKPMLVTYHHPAYASGVANIFMPAPPAYAKEHWLPLFAQYGVKLVMNGHEHVYERLLINGVNYVNAGPAGGTFGRTKPFATSYTQKLIKKTRTVTIVTVRASGAVKLATHSPDQGGMMIDELRF